MIEAVADRLEGAPRRLRRRWSDEFAAKSTRSCVELRCLNGLTLSLTFMKTLKQEEVQGLAYRDADDARRRIGAFIDTVYNAQRLHSALDYLTPQEYEQKHSGGRRREKAA